MRDHEFVFSVEITKTTPKQLNKQLKHSKKEIKKILESVKNNSQQQITEYNRKTGSKQCQHNKK